MAGGDTTTYVESYVRSDGTKVRGHVRHVHGGDGPGGSPRGGGKGSAPGSVPSSGDWSSLRGEWRDGAGRSKAPKGGINPNSLISDGRVQVTLPMPASAPAHPTIEEVTVRMSDPATQEMLVATYKRGQVSRTKNQRKWLAAELSDEDRTQLARDYDESVLCSNKVVYMSGHLRDKVARGELSVPQDVVEETLRNFADSFIEYNVTERNGQQSRRVLLRNNSVRRQVNVRGREQEANLCLVLDIDTCCMITAYWNAADDHHDTLNYNRYERGGQGGPHGDRGAQGRSQGNGNPRGSSPGHGPQDGNGGGGKRRRRRH